MPDLMSGNKVLRWVGLLFAEMTLAEAGLSYLAIIVLRVSGFGDDYGPTLIVLMLALLVYFAVTIVFLNRCCFDLMDKKKYYKAAGIAYGAFIVLSIVFRYVCYNDTYTWLFGMYKILSYSFLPIGSLGSVMIVHVLMITAILIVPQHLSYLFTDETSWTDREYKIYDIAEALKHSLATESERRAVLVGFSDELTYDDITELLKDDN